MNCRRSHGWCGDVLRYSPGWFRISLFRARTHTEPVKSHANNVKRRSRQNTYLPPSHSAILLTVQCLGSLLIITWHFPDLCFAFSFSCSRSAKTTFSNLIINFSNLFSEFFYTVLSLSYDLRWFSWLPTKNTLLVSDWVIRTRAARGCLSVYVIGCVCVRRWLACTCLSIDIYL